MGRMLQQPGMMETLATLRRRLLAERVPAGHWRGELSGSALSTAVAAFALAQADREAHAGLIERGLDWLVAHAHADGGWGDTPDSPGNIATTLLCWSALSSVERSGAAREAAVVRAAGWLKDRAGGLEPGDLARAVGARYGADRTFSAPILAMAAAAGRLGASEEAWGLVAQLPFELAILPHGLFKALRLTVVSYAMPALIAIGLLRHRRLADASTIRRRLRNWAAPRLLTRLARMQPASGGFLEAAPLTGFVVMALAAAGHADHEVARRGAAFLAASARPDGSWPIDTDLATWVTTLSVNALASRDGGPPDLPPEELAAIRRWLLAQQHRVEHSMTHSPPGGWAWTDLPGGVPDGDDTPGVLLALRRLDCIDQETKRAAALAVRWLLGLQNADGGIPTFCRGWGKLPFDRSCADLTAHALQALMEWRADLPELRLRMDRALSRGLAYLAGVQRPDGSWVPLWFGNQHAPDEESPTYGTARVVAALRELASHGRPAVEPLLRRGVEWLVAAQNADGGWGGAPGVASSLEETALAATALAGGEPTDALSRGVAWIIERTGRGGVTPASPIGLYFARLWYAERLYPLIFAAGALGKLVRRQAVLPARDARRPATSP